MVNSSTYAKNVVPNLSNNTVLYNGKKNYSKSISLVNRPLNNWRVSVVNHQKQLKNILIPIRKFGLTAWLQDPL
jgi:hypothetical protein